MEKEKLNKLNTLIQEKNWNDTLKILKKIKDVDVELGYNHNLLHKACQYQGPLSIIKKIYNLSESHIRQTTDDENWYLPFHVAIKYDAPIDVIEFVLKKNISAASAVDSNGNTPMHTLILDYDLKISSLQHEKDILSYDKYMLKVCKLLCNVSSSSMSQLNNDDLSPVDISIDKRVKPDILVLMWNTDRYAMTESSRKLVNLHKNNVKNKGLTQQRKASFTGGFTSGGSNEQTQKPVRRRSSMWT